MHWLSCRQGRAGWRVTHRSADESLTVHVSLTVHAGGYAGLSRVMQWNLGFMARSDQGEQYLELAQVSSGCGGTVCGRGRVWSVVSGRGLW